jgi:hypothetical protein
MIALFGETQMARALIVILLWMAMLVLPCVVAPRIDLDED